jgi:hypothetical protein
VTFRELLADHPHWQGYRTARQVLHAREAERDFIERYRSVPLHGVFLFSSEDKEVQQYIEEHWDALDRLSADFCDLYPSIHQLRASGEDAYSLLNDRSFLASTSEISVKALPGIFFWDLTGESAYLPLWSENGLDRSKIRWLLREVFDYIRRSPTIASVRQATGRIPAPQDRLLYGGSAASRSYVAPVSPLSVVFFAANPRETSRLALDEEIREITRKMRMADERNRTNVVQAWATRPEDLLQYLHQYRPDIVHFSGHGSAQGELLLNDSDGRARPVPAEALKELFEAFKDTVQLVLLNACYSKVQGQAIAEAVEYVIGMNEPISDAAATIFASSFYSALGFNRNFEEAFRLARIALMLEGGVNQNVPELLVKSRTSNT